MDQVAATAAVSKQTVYKHFGEKRALLYAIVTDELDATVTKFRELISELAETTDIEASLIALAMEYLQAVLRDRVVQLRRLVIAEASRLPELAQLYYDRAPSRTLSALADAFRRLHQRGLLYALAIICADLTEVRSLAVDGLDTLSARTRRDQEGRRAARDR